MRIALTFDDGPNEPYTRQILDVLAEYGAKATFFVIGKWVRLVPELAREIIKHGQEIGSHTHTHPQLSQIGAEHANNEWNLCNKAIYEAGIETNNLMRCPFGDVAHMADGWHTPWDVHGGDWGPNATVESICQPIFERLDTGQDSIVLLHDGYYKEFGADRSKTVEATRRILERYPKAEFVTISQYKEVPVWR